MYTIELPRTKTRMFWLKGGWIRHTELACFFLLFVALTQAEKKTLMKIYQVCQFSIMKDFAL